MPILSHAELRRLNQEEFESIAAEVMQHVFTMHDDFGRLFDETIYKRELARRMSAVRLETPVDAVLGTFSKRYYFDLIVGDGALFEFKTRETLVARHRAQALHYVFLAGAAQAKIVNFRSEKVEHESITTTLTLAERRHYTIQDQSWNPSVPGAARFREVLCECLNEWGAGLELGLYQDALEHFLEGPGGESADIAVWADATKLGSQQMHLVCPGVAFRLTAFTDESQSFASHARRLLLHTDLEALLWANITTTNVDLVTLQK